MVGRGDPVAYDGEEEDDEIVERREREASWQHGGRCVGRCSGGRRRKRKRVTEFREGGTL